MGRKALIPLTPASSEHRPKGQVFQIPGRKRARLARNVVASASTSCEQQHSTDQPAAPMPPVRQPAMLEDLERPLVRKHGARQAQMRGHRVRSVYADLHQEDVLLLGDSRPVAHRQWVCHARPGAIRCAELQDLDLSLPNLPCSPFRRAVQPCTSLRPERSPVVVRGDHEPLTVSCSRQVVDAQHRAAHAIRLEHIGMRGWSPTGSQPSMPSIRTFSSVTSAVPKSSFTSMPSPV